MSEEALLIAGDSLFQRQQRAKLYFLFERKEKLQALLESQTNYNTDSELLNSSTNAFLYGVLRFNEGKYAEANRYYNDAVNYELKDYEAALAHYTRAEEQHGTANPLLKARATMARSQMINIVGERSVAFELLDSAIEHFVTLEDISSLAYA